MIGRNWKYHDEGDETDVDPIQPVKKNCRSIGKCVEAMTLCEIEK